MKNILNPNEGEEIPLPRPFVSKDKKLVRVGVPADGNCFFHAVMRSCNIESELSADRFRMAVAHAYLDYHKEYKLQDLMDIEEAMFELKSPGRWVDERYTDCIGKALKVKIAIVTSNEKGETIQAPGTKICGCETSDQIVVLYFVPGKHHYEYVCLIHDEKIYSIFPDDHVIFSRGFSK